MRQEKFEIIDGLPSRHSLDHVIASDVNAFTTIATVALNTLTILTYGKSTQLKVSNFLIMVPSSIDFRVGIIGSLLLPWVLENEVARSGRRWSCYANVISRILLGDIISDTWRYKRVLYTQWLIGPK